MRLADPHFDFTGHDILMVVMPSTNSHGADAGGRVYTQERIPNDVTDQHRPVR